MVTTWNLC